MKNLTVVWDQHGGGKLIGVFDDDMKVEKLKEYVKSNNQESYIRFFVVELNSFSEISFF